MKTPKIVDCFLFWNELPLLKARLEYLGSTVDQFVIIEANVDFSGKYKGFLLNNQMISKLPHSSKIIYQRINLNLHSPEWLIKKIRYISRRSKYLWKIQDAQRNSLLTALKNFPKDILIIWGDIDEIPRINTVIKIVNDQKTLEKLPITLEQDFFYYTLNNPSNNATPWHGSVITNLTKLIKIKPHRLRFLREQLPSEANGGWHLSYFMSPEQIKEKIMATYEVEKKDEAQLISEKLIVEKINTGRDLFSEKDVFIKNEIFKCTVDITLINAINKYLPHCN